MDCRIGGLKVRLSGTSKLMARQCQPYISDPFAMADIDLTYTKDDITHYQGSYLMMTILNTITRCLNLLLRYSIMTAFVFIHPHFQWTGKVFCFQQIRGQESPLMPVYGVRI